MAEQDRVIGGSRALCFALAGALLLAGCATTAPSAPGPAGGQQAAEAPPSAYIKMMRENGINVAVPTRGKFIMVNIPSYELVAFKDGEPVLRSRVVVGQPATRTPELISSMFAVRFNPSWTPTPSMIRNEAAVYIPPGPNNPLGRMMLELDNDQFIYLHDTNQKGLFKRDRRAFSHGCIRVEQVRALAAWALGVTEDEIGKMVARGSTYSVPLPEEIPVFLVYYTRFPDEHGQIASYPDVYANWQAEERAYLARAAARRMAAPAPAAPVKPAAAPADSEAPRPAVPAPTPAVEPAAPIAPTAPATSAAPSGPAAPQAQVPPPPPATVTTGSAPAGEAPRPGSD